MNGTALVRVQAFAKKGSEADTHGIQNVILVPIAGKLPSKRVIAGTIALASGLAVSDRPVVVSFVELPASEEYGRQFSFTCADRSSNALETMQLITALGEPGIINVEEKVEELANGFEL